MLFQNTGKCWWSKCPGSAAGFLLCVHQQVAWALGTIIWPAFEICERLLHSIRPNGLAYGRHLCGRIRSPRLTLKNRLGKAMPDVLRCRKEYHTAGTQFVLCLQSEVGQTGLGLEKTLWHGHTKGPLSSFLRFSNLLRVLGDRRCW